MTDHPVFQIVDGLLQQVDADTEAKMRATRSTRAVHGLYEIFFTDEEQAEIDRQAAETEAEASKQTEAIEAQQKAASSAREAKDALRQTALSKLKALGLTEEEIQAII